jgi:hypothetical protein
MTIRRLPVRLLLLSGFASFLLYFFYLYNHKSEIRNLGFDHESKKTNQTITPEKELVVASLVGDDISWLDEPFSDWKTNIYVVNDPNASLTVPKNKGREAMAYLTYARHRLSVYPSSNTIYLGTSSIDTILFQMLPYLYIVCATSGIMKTLCMVCE